MKRFDWDGGCGITPKNAITLPVEVCYWRFIRNSHLHISNFICNCNAQCRRHRLDAYSLVHTLIKAPDTLSNFQWKSFMKVFMQVLQRFQIYKNILQNRESFLGKNFHEFCWLSISMKKSMISCPSFLHKSLFPWRNSFIIWNTCSLQKHEKFHLHIDIQRLYLYTYIVPVPVRGQIRWGWGRLPVYNSRKSHSLDWSIPIPNKLPS